MRKCIKYFCFPWLMIISLGVKKFFNKLQKNFDIPVSQNSLSVGLKRKNRVKLTVKWSMCVCVDLFQSIWDQLKFRVNKLQMEANKSTAKQFFGKASGTKERVTHCARTALLPIHTLFSFNKNVVFPAQTGIFLVSCQF